MSEIVRRNGSIINNVKYQYISIRDRRDVYPYKNIFETHEIITDVEMDSQDWSIYFYVCEFDKFNEPLFDPIHVTYQTLVSFKSDGKTLSLWRLGEKLYDLLTLIEGKNYYFVVGNESNVTTNYTLIVRSLK